MNLKIGNIKWSIWLDENGFGTAIYSLKEGKSIFFNMFANKISDEERSDRVIATKWDAAFTLHDGIPSKEILKIKNEVLNRSWKTII